jgi:hypothetical protein
MTASAWSEIADLRRLRRLARTRGARKLGRALHWRDFAAGSYLCTPRARKLIYLSIINAQKSWKQTYHWSSALLSFKIHFGDRLP